MRDCLHPRDLLPLLRRQVAPGARAPVRVLNLGGGASHAMSLAELSAWCSDRFGPHDVAANPEIRRFDIPWLIMDSTAAREIWGWHPVTSVGSILEEIALHAEQHPQWLELSGHE